MNRINTGTPHNTCEIEEKTYTNNTTMVTDIAKRGDEDSKRLVEYFLKNFDVNFEE